MRAFKSIQIRALSLVLASTLSVYTSAQAQTANPASPWPNKAVRVIVPFAAGSFTDTAARAVSAELSVQFGQPFVIESKGGAGSTLGTDLVAKAAPDGYTLLVTDNSFAVSAALYAKLPYDPEKDISKISTIAEAPAVMMVRQSLPVNNVKELVELSKKQTNKLSFGSGGQGSSAHLAMERFLISADTSMTHVPYKGVAAALVDLIAGHIDVGIASVGSAAAHIKGGKVKGLAVASTTRYPALPNVPTFAESGYPDYNVVYWFGMMAPAGLPPSVQERLQQAIAKAVTQPKVIEIFAAAGAKAVASSSPDFSKRVDEETRNWKRVITKANIKPE
jgi:tripartite-type tricarboxylate transporter receptor subunit TctC